MDSLDFYNMRTSIIYSLTLSLMPKKKDTHLTSILNILSFIISLINIESLTYFPLITRETKVFINLKKTNLYLTDKS